MNIFKHFYAYLKLRKAIRLADKAHQLSDHRRFYVVPTLDGSRKLLIMDRSNFRLLKHKRYISSKAFVHDLTRECFYFTPDRSGRAITPDLLAKKKAIFYRWFSNRR